MTTATDSDAVAALDRLEASFGGDAIEELIVDFAATLREALVALERGEGVPIAHRIAGIAGTLGFMKASQAWIALSHNAPSAENRARDEAQRALTTLAARESARR